jgi:hypothetical protein
MCQDFERALEDRTSEYHEACSNNLYRYISSRFVAFRDIEMDRAKSDLQMHRSVCATVLADADHLPIPASV